MKSYLYKDLYDLEEKHWWHIAKRKSVVTLIKKYSKGKLKILDIGCGTGRNLEELSKIGESWGLDSSDEALEFCKKRGLKNLVKSGAEKTKFKDSNFTLISMLDVLEHTDDNKTLTEAYRILKSGGFVIITVPAYQFLWSKWDEVLHHKRRYTKSNLTQLLETNRFKIVSISYLYSFLVIPALLIRFVKSFIYRGNNYQSDFKLSSPPINKALELASDMERSIMLKVPIPFGTSIICVAKKI